MRTKILGPVMGYSPLLAQKIGDKPCLLLMQLDWMQDNGMGVELRPARVAQMMGWNEKTAGRILNKLIDLGMIQDGRAVLPDYILAKDKMSDNTPQETDKMSGKMTHVPLYKDIEERTYVEPKKDKMSQAAEVPQDDKHKSIRAVLDAMRAKGIKLQGGENELRDLVDVLQEPTRAKYLGDIAQFVSLHDKPVDNWPAFITGVVKSWNKKGYSQLPRPKPGTVVNLTGEARAKALASERLAAFAAGWHAYRHSLGEHFREAGGKLLGGWFDDPQKSYEYALAWAAGQVKDGQPSNDLKRHWGAMQQFIQNPTPDPSPNTGRGDETLMAVAS